SSSTPSGVTSRRWKPMAGKSGTCDAIRSDSQRPSGASSTPPGWRWTRGGNPGETVKRSRPRCIPDDAGRGSSQNQDGGGTEDDVRCTIYDLRFTMDDVRFTMDDVRWTMDDGRWTMDDLRWTIW